MASFTRADLGNRLGDVIEAAFAGPVDITERGKRKFVFLTAEDFDRIAGRSSQRAYHVNDLTDAEREELIAGLEAVARGEGLDD